MKFDACPLYSCNTAQVRLDAFHYDPDCRLLAAATSSSHVGICRAVQRLNTCRFTHFVAFVTAITEGAVQSVRIRMASSAPKPLMPAGKCEYYSRCSLMPVPCTDAVQSTRGLTPAIVNRITRSPLLDLQCTRVHLQGGPQVSCLSLHPVSLPVSKSELKGPYSQSTFRSPARLSNL